MLLWLEPARASQVLPFIHVQALPTFSRATPAMTLGSQDATGPGVSKNRRGEGLTGPFLPGPHPMGPRPAGRWAGRVGAQWGPSPGAGSRAGLGGSWPPNNTASSFCPTTNRRTIGFFTGVAVTRTICSGAGLAPLRRSVRCSSSDDAWRNYKSSVDHFSQTRQAMINARGAGPSESPIDLSNGSDNDRKAAHRR